MATATAKKKKTTRKPKMTYCWGALKTEGNATQKDLLGGKGANLAEMTSIGLPVPPGFTIPTTICEAYYIEGGNLPAGLDLAIAKAIAQLERETGKKFGSQTDPLLVSVRSGAAVSMPGMMDTVLNLGLTDEAVKGLIALTGNARFGWDAYRRLINMFGDVVMGMEHEVFEHEFSKVKQKFGVVLDTELSAEGLEEVCDRYKKVYRRHVGKAFPQDPIAQLSLSVEAVFKSWNTHRAKSYRQINDITGLRGTAVNVQAMVFGNMGTDSGTGVAFTRNPSTGEDKFFGEFLIDAQGEDVVAGIRTPKPVSQMKKWNSKIFNELLKIKKTLEKHYSDMQDIEFTIERGKLWMLQTRTGKRTAAAAVKLAVDMVRSRMIKIDEALLRIPAGDLVQLLLPSFTAKSKHKVQLLAKGLPASPGAVTGTLAFSAEDAVTRAEAGENVLLVRKETSPEDIDGMHHAVGILTSTGGMTSHAAVVARGWGKCCVAGASDLHIDASKKCVTIQGVRYKGSDVFSIDGGTGEVMLGAVERHEPKLSGDFDTIMKWADQRRRMNVRTNADSPQDSGRARAFGAEGIGLTRTEHMFFEGDRILAMRRMILAETKGKREESLARLMPYQRDDFIGIFTAMKGLPVTVRLLDPPLHEFLPHDRAGQKEVADAMGMKLSKVKRRVEQLHEFNPMLGHRGCRLAVTYPEILVMQVTAITEAVIACKRKRVDARPEIMIPLVGVEEELKLLRDLAAETIKTIAKKERFRGTLNIPIGTMIEIPRAALVAEEIAEVADFFSFGTNDLTQLTYGFSRDDINGFLPHYLESGILERDPFQTIDRDGVGRLVLMGCQGGRKTNSALKIGICGEHGGDPSSVEFCHDVGLDYVSCSPFRVPTARLAAAQAAIKESLR
ncbi:MAG: pyruvate, phosphate dikinase [Phycisphaerales bacterium]|jgi:pyruvate,orthophosphate dikinase|nr:pyruvate, phosphate dikinase [Phycisphaerales bacterium]